MLGIETFAIVWRLVSCSRSMVEDAVEQNGFSTALIRIIIFGTTNLIELRGDLLLNLYTKYLLSICEGKVNVSTRI